MKRYGINKVADIECELGDYKICPEMSNVRYYTGSDNNRYMDLTEAVPCLLSHCAKYKSVCCGKYE